MKLDLITDLPKLEQVEIEGVRHYTAEGVGPYPSVTTVLGADPKKKATTSSSAVSGGTGAGIGGAGGRDFDNGFGVNLR